jgi:transglutaminase-like putative cysteine protease
MRAQVHQQRLQRREPVYVTACKAVLYASALVFYLRSLSSVWGIAAAIIGAGVGDLVARLAHRRQLRLPVGLGLALGLSLAGVLAGDGLRDASLLAPFLGADLTFLLTDVLTFGAVGLALVFFLRLASQRARIYSLLEVLFVAGAVVLMLADHRNRMLNRPRFLSDWAWSLGIDPTAVLLVIGATVALLSVLLFLRDQPLTKVVTTFALLLLIGVAYYVGDYLMGGERISGTTAADALGLSGRDDRSKEQGRGKYRKGGRGSAKNPFKDDYDSLPPQPVAVAILRDDYEAGEGVIYFRQRVLSAYNGVHLTADTPRDGDVIVKLPSRGAIQARPSQSDRAHVEVPTTMYLLVDHPQPPTLVHATQIEPVDNPNPRQFVAAYNVLSQVLSVPPLRLLGRKSIPEQWDERARLHYTALPDDPRYRTLSDTIVRTVDPRFANDDLAKAFAIKRYLEQRGFYTRRSTHASHTDPTASFLFGNLRGYCVHFAHAAVYLMRSQGLAARVALGYAVQTTKRSGGSTILIMSDRAHAWPELHLAGVGWVTFDIYPERTDLPPAMAVDYDLEKLMGELARDQPPIGMMADAQRFSVPWGKVGYAGLFVGWALLISAFLLKAVRRLWPRLMAGPAYERLAYRALLDRLAEVGYSRERGETREQHAARLSAVTPSFRSLTAAHMAAAFGSRRSLRREQFNELLRSVRADLRRNIPTWKRVAGVFNPFSWLWSR